MTEKIQEKLLISGCLGQLVPDGGRGNFTVGPVQVVFYLEYTVACHLTVGKY